SEWGYRTLDSDIRRRAPSISTRYSKCCTSTYRATCRRSTTYPLSAYGASSGKNLCSLRRRNFVDPRIESEQPGFHGLINAQTLARSVQRIAYTNHLVS